MPTTIALNFDNKSEVFFPGQLITGHVEVNTTNEKQVRCITLLFYGHAKVRWKYTVGGTNKRTGVGIGRQKRTGGQTRIAQAGEHYYENEYRLWGSGLSMDKFPPGRHIFNFSFRLPQMLPSSFEGSKGRVRHSCKAEFHVPLGFNKTAFKYITVNSIYDLNLDPSCVVPIQLNKSKNLCCCCCKSGPFSLNVSLSKSGFVPGEKMLINATFDNKTDSAVIYTEAKLFKQITYITPQKRHRTSFTVASIKGESIEPGEDDSWVNKELKIPPLPPSSLPNCNIIDLEYRLEILAHFDKACTQALTKSTPIIIGSIPLRQTFQYFVPAQPQPPGYYPGYAPGVPQGTPGYAPGVPQGTPGYAPGAPQGQPGYPPVVPQGPPGYPQGGYQPQYGPIPGQMPSPAQYAPPIETKDGAPPDTKPLLSDGANPDTSEVIGFNPGAKNPSGDPAGNIVPTAPGMPGGQPPNSSPFYGFMGMYENMPQPEFVTADNKNDESDGDDENDEEGGPFKPRYFCYNPNPSAPPQ